MNSIENITFRHARSNSDTAIINRSENIILTDSLNNGSASLPYLLDENDDEQVEILKLKVEKLTADLKKANEKIETLTERNDELQQINEKLLKKNNVHQKITSTPIESELSTPKSSLRSYTRHFDYEDNLSNENELTVKRTERYELIKKQRKNKICIVSTNNTNKILPIAQNKLKSYNICHYIKSNCGTQQLLKGLKTKLINYTMNDYCVILIGEHDFKKTENYFKLIMEIRTSFKDINNTNIIICVPTFKFNGRSDLYNSRIETFNNLLYLDIMTHFHAYFLDSNLNLNYDSTMFNQHTGILNNRGMNVVFECIKQLIQELSTDFATENEKNYYYASDEVNTVESTLCDKPLGTEKAFNKQSQVTDDQNIFL